MLCTETTLDLWHEGYGNGLSNSTWVQAVAGRFLTMWQRIALLDGMKSAKEDQKLWTEDMRAKEYAYPETV